MSPSGNTWKVGVAALALLVIGAALGIAADRLHHRAPTVVVVRHLGENGVAASLAFLDSVLALSPAQREEVHRILAQRQAPIDSIWSHTHRALQTSLDSTTDQLVRVLDAGQQARFHEVFGTPSGPGANRHRH